MINRVNSFHIGEWPKYLLTAALNRVTDINISLSFSLPDIEYARNYAKMAESAKTLASQQVTKEPPCMNILIIVKLLWEIF